MNPRTATARNGAPSPLRGMAYMLFCALSFTLMNAVIRHVSATLHPLEIAFFRSLFGLLVFAPLFMRYGFEPLRSRRSGMLLLRGGINWTLLTKVETSCDRILIAGGANVEAEWEQGPAV